MSLPPNDLVVKFDVLHHRVVHKGKKRYVVSGRYSTFCSYQLMTISVWEIFEQS